jgi:uncharacterized protein YukE
MQFGDQALRQAAAAMERLADQVRGIGVRAAAEADGLDWRSRGAERFQESAGASAAAIHDCAARLDHAAQRLRWHADRCRQTQDRLTPWS